jgi:hypothetical protein
LGYSHQPSNLAFINNVAPLPLRQGRGGDEMKIIVDFRDFEEGSKEADILLSWICETMMDKGCDNHTPLRYADSVKIVEAAED